jgi:hypothetical protein
MRPATLRRSMRRGRAIGHSIRAETLSLAMTASVVMLAMIIQPAHILCVAIAMLSCIARRDRPFLNITCLERRARTLPQL